VIRKDKRLVRNFLERQGDLVLKEGGNAANSRIDAVDAEMMVHYFKKILTVISTIPNLYQ